MEMTEFEVRSGEPVSAGAPGFLQITCAYVPHHFVDGVRRPRPRGEARYSHDADADAPAITIVERIADLVAARPMPDRSGGGGRCSLHSHGAERSIPTWSGR